MYPRTTAQERDERDRVAWNLPRRPSAAPAPTVQTSSTTGSPFGLESPGQYPTAERALDWEGFLLRYFPGRRRHHLPAIVAYGAYRASGGVDTPAGHVARPEVARPLTAETAATDSWEDEGGAPWPEKLNRGASSRRDRSRQPVETVLTGRQGGRQ